MSTNIIFRCDGGTQLGMGHVTRCIELAFGFKKLGLKRILFLIYSKEKVVFEKIKKTGFKFLKCPFSLGGKNDLNFVKKFSKFNNSSSPILICDSFNTSKNYLKECSKFFFLVLINDLMKQGSFINILINASTKEKRTIIPLYKKETNLIRKEFFIQKSKKKINDKILITMGAGDPNNVTGWFLNNFYNELKNEKIYVLIGSAFKYKKQIKYKFIKKYKNIKIFFDLDKPSKIMKESSFAISAAGNMSLELAALGIPQILISIDNTQKMIINFLRKNSCVKYLGYYKNLNKKKTRFIINNFLKNESFKKRLRKKALNIFNNPGNVNIAEKIFKEYKRKSNFI